MPTQGQKFVESMLEKTTVNGVRECLLTVEDLSHKPKYAREVVEILDAAANYGDKILSQRGDAPYVVIPPETALATLAVCHLASVPPNLADTVLPAILESLFTFLGNLRRPMTPVITKEEIHRVLSEDRPSRAARVIGFWSPFVVFLLPFQDVTFNSSYSAPVNGIILSVPKKDADQDPLTIFLHELGHALQVTLTKSPVEAPASFGVAVDPYLKMDFRKIPPEAQGELFALAFAQAAAYGTWIEKKAEGVSLPPQVSPYLARYFDTLMDEAEKASLVLSCFPWDMVWTREMTQKTIAEEHIDLPQRPLPPEPQTRTGIRPGQIRFVEAHSARHPQRRVVARRVKRS